MKKALLGTTALVAGGLFATAVVAADLSPAPDPEPVEEGFTLNVSGFMTAFFLFRSNDEYGSTHDVDPTQISLSSEIYFDAEQTLANGLTISAHIQMEAQRETGNNIDEAYLKLVGHWGEVRIGGEDGALNLSDTSMAVAGIYGDVDGPSFVAISSSTAPTGTFSGVTSDDNKIIYFTPRMGGIKLAASFTPNTKGNGPAFHGGGDSIPHDSGSDFVNVWDIAANLEHSWGDYKIVVAGGFESAEGQTTSTVGDVDIWNAGVTLASSYGTLGFKYSARDNNLATATVDDATAWAVQGTIKSGDTTFGAGYLRGEADLTAGTS
ncbi:MAG: porin, partial [Alphaproteobacteria bacterium]